MYRSSLVGALFFLLAPMRVLASEQTTGSPKVAESGDPVIRIENVRLVGSNPHVATISYDLVNRGNSEIARAQLDGVGVQHFIEPLKVMRVGMGMTACPDAIPEKPVPVGGANLVAWVKDIPASVKVGSSVSVDFPLSPIVIMSYCFWGRYAYYICLKAADGHVWDERRLEIETQCSADDTVGGRSHCVVRKAE